MSGKFVWHDLITSDANAAIAFYTELVGWRTQPFAADSPYRLLVSAQGPMGGVMAVSEEMKKNGARPHWMGHVEVDDLDATVAQVPARGGVVQVPPTEIPTVGRFSVIADPQGASLSVLQRIEKMPAHEMSKSGEIGWNELMTSDYRAGFEFYTALFGWKQLDEMDMGETGKYLLFGQGEQMYGGIMNTPAGVPTPPGWLYYLNVDDLDAAVTRATTKGATKLFGPQQVPGETWVAQLSDPQGAMFALHGRRRI